MSRSLVFNLSAPIAAQTLVFARAAPRKNESRGTFGAQVRKGQTGLR